MDKQPSSKRETSSEDHIISGFINTLGFFSPSSEQSITTTLFNIPTCDAAKPTPEYLYIVSIISKQSFLILLSILVTGIQVFLSLGSGCKSTVSSLIKDYLN